jgi:hypothetical protein
MNEQLLETTVLEVLKDWDRRERGWWYGHEVLMEEVNEKLNSDIPIPKIKEALKVLRKEGKVRTEPIYKEENGLLNGSGYFFNFD